jgi:hypothetical protein
MIGTESGNINARKIIYDYEFLVINDWSTSDVIYAVLYGTQTPAQETAGV